MEPPIFDLKAEIGTLTEDSFIMNPTDQREHTRSRNDVQTRRMKNRERQRRYRARKRLEADMKKPTIIKQSTPPEVEVEVQLNGFASNYTPRVHCKRDWKKDARRAHVSKDPEVTLNGCAVPPLMSTSKSQTVFLSGTMAEPVLDSITHSEISVNQSTCDLHRPKHGRRDWKSDARNKNT